MKTAPAWTKWLVIAALADWLLTRTLTRLGIFMPKSPVVIQVYQAIGIIGQFAAVLTGLLVLVGLLWMALDHYRHSGGRLFPAACLAAALLSLLFLFESPSGWVAVGYHLLLAGLFIFLGSPVLRPAPKAPQVALGVSALALLAREVYLLIPALYQALRLPGPPGFQQSILMAAELLVLLGVAALFWAFGRTHDPQGRDLRLWVWAALLPIGLTAFWLANPSMLGILTIWSVGLTLYLPWFLYALALWMAGMVVLVSRRQGSLAGWAVLLLLAGGFNPQLSAQALFGIVALRMMQVPGSTYQAPAKEFVALPLVRSSS